MTMLSEFPCPYCGGRHPMSRAEAEGCAIIPVSTCPNQRNYIFHWRNGTNETLQGTDPADALSRAGYGRGALAALDHYEQTT